MSYTAPQYVDTKEQAVLALASTIKGEAVTGGDGSVNRALDILADVLAEQDVQVPQTDAGAILALAQYAGGMVKPEGTIAITENGEGIDVAQYATADVSVSGGGGGDLTTANVTLVNTKTGSVYLTIPCEDEESETSSCEAYAEGEASVTVRAILYKGTCRAVNNGNSINVSGDAVYTPTPFDPTSGPITITGDCTITFSD